MTTQQVTPPTATISNALVMTFFICGCLLLSMIYLIGSASQSTYSVENIVPITELSNITDPCVKRNLLTMLTPDMTSRMDYQSINIRPIYQADVNWITRACQIKHDVTIDPIAIEQLKALNSTTALVQ